MGQERIGEVIEALQKAGFRADRGYPGKGMPYPDEPVVAVNLHRQQSDQLTLAIHVYSTVEHGGRVCEDLSMDIAALLEDLDAGCTVENCDFDGKSGLFSMRILAAWNNAATPAPVFAVQAGQQRLHYVTAVSARRDRDQQMQGNDLVTEDKGWFITVTEKLPLADWPGEDSGDSFALTISHGDATETYPDCRWSELYYEPLSDGVLRRRVARCWGERTITEA